MSRLVDIRGPEDIKQLSLAELAGLAEELRETITSSVSKTGGHLASSLGVVELTIALHYVFDSPRDRFVWDVGHQSYPHKLLTGRLKDFPTLRQYKGLAGFPKRTESPHDSFDTGHSSTSISAASGMVEARDIMGKPPFKAIAIIGDGAMTAGLAFEGLNHAGHRKKDLIVVLNDNEMSISENVGALSKYLNRLLTGDTYRRFKRETRQILESIPRVGGPVSRFAQRLEESLKALVLPGMLFEELGFNYIGPLDGHNIGLLIETFRKIKGTEGPTLVHVITKKGKGYSYSEDDPCSYHGVGPFEIEIGLVAPGTSADTSNLTYSEVFGLELANIADHDPAVAAITAAMKEGTGLAPFAARHPKRFFDVGIAEPHAVTFAAGLATQGVKPVVAIYSTFLQRSYDEIVHDVALQGLHVVFAIDRGGVVGEDGPTHHGVFDISYLRHVPELALMAPKDAEELRAMLRFAVDYSGPIALRYPRGKAITLGPCPAIELGKAEVIREGSRLALLAIGNMTGPAIAAAERLASEGIEPTVVNMRFVKPMDTGMLDRIAATHQAVLTIEENALQGGFGSAVVEHYADTGKAGALTILRMGLPDEFVEQGKPDELRRLYGLDAEGVYRAAMAVMGKTRSGKA